MLYITVYLYVWDGGRCLELCYATHHCATPAHTEHKAAYDAVHEEGPRSCAQHKAHL